jgi:hypothetical protein
MKSKYEIEVDVGGTLYKSSNPWEPVRISIYHEDRRLAEKILLIVRPDIIVIHPKNGVEKA